jgi:esterase/lipase superfamily enzyme
LGVNFVMFSRAPVASRRAVLRGLASAGSLMALGGCAALPSALQTADATESRPTLLIATNRKPVNGAKKSPWFGFERAQQLTVARARLTAPEEGRFTLSAVGLDVWQLDSLEIAPRLNDLLAQNPAPRDVLIYVHGYNHTFSQSLGAAARLADGIKFKGDAMVFSWPSKGSLFDYGYDRESAMWSRDALERVLARLIGSPYVARIHVVAHSIGTMVAMEALRESYARRGSSLVARLGAVVFAAPDIDIDVFRSSVQRVGALASRITVIVASNDRALAVSGWIAGGTPRVGTADKAELKSLGLHVIDASQQGWGVVNHDLFMSNYHIRQIIRRAIDGLPVDDA